MAGKQNEYYKELEKQICLEYRAGVDSLRDVAHRLDTNHKLVGKYLRKNNIEIIKAPPKPISDIHKRKIGEKSKGIEAWNKGTKAKKNKPTGHKRVMPMKNRIENMRSHMRWDIDVSFLEKFEDFNKLKFLNKSISRKRDFGEISTEYYKEFILKFYNEPQFNLIYSKWKDNGEQNLLKPSLDHIFPKSRGGSNELDNLQFLTWFENRCKNDMTQDEWNSLKLNIKEYLI